MGSHVQQIVAGEFCLFRDEGESGFGSGAHQPLGRIGGAFAMEPDDWKPFDDVGPGTREIRIRDANGAWRVMYVARFEEAVYVLHCFQKKTQATSRRDKAIAGTRYRAVVNMRKVGK